MARKRGNGEGSVYFDAKRRRYVAAVTLDFRRDGSQVRRAFVGKTRAEAVAKMDAEVALLRQGLPLPSATETVGGFLEHWRDEVLPGSVSLGTEEVYRRVLRLYVLPVLSKIKLRDLTPAHVSDLLRIMEDEGLAAETQRMARAVLRRALRRAEQEGRVSRNVAAIADGPRVRRAEGRTLTPEQAKALLKAAADERLEGAIVLMISLGLRRGETLGLAWHDIDLDRVPATLRVRRQLQRLQGCLQLVDVKTPRSKRTLYLPDALVELLRSHRAKQGEERLLLGPEWRNSDGLVFATPKGTPVEPRNFSKVVSDVCRRAAIGHWSPHELRHSCASLMLAMGVPLEVVSETLGHSSIRLTKDVYGHLMEPARKDAAKAMQRALWE